MRPTGVLGTADAPAWLVGLAAEYLSIPPEELDPHTPLSRYGLDSLAAAELTTALSAALGRELRDTLLFECPDLASLHAALMSPEPDRLAPAGDPMDTMLADAELPLEVRPEGGAPREPIRTVLLTGATGFLGTHLLRALLGDPALHVRCLVRADGRHPPQARLRDTLARHHLWEASFAGRIDIVPGDLACPRLGLSSKAFGALASTVDAIYHCGAVVNWAAPYLALRPVNVVGTRELLRLACLDYAKPFHFVSSVAVCHAFPGPRDVSETQDMLPHLGGLHLGYAQSKCVAESLVRQAGARGLPVTIYRPGLIGGDTNSGHSNPDDLVSRLTRACIEMGTAPDLDVELDCCPVDFVAEAVARLSRQSAGGPRVFHLVHPRARHWREYVLWLNFLGYQVRLDPYRVWLRRLARTAADPRHPLHGLRPFFFMRPAAQNGLTLPELYERAHRGRIRHATTDRAIEAVGLRCPSLDAALLNRYFAAYIAGGVLRPPGRPRRPGCPTGLQLGPELFTRLLRQWTGDPALRVMAATPLAAASGQSIVTELTAWRDGDAAGLFPFRLAVDSSALPTGSIEVMVKVKAEDETVLEIGCTLARLTDPALGRLYARFQDRLGITGRLPREVAVYGQHDPRVRRHVPALYGAAEDTAGRARLLLLERLCDVVLMDSANDPLGWPREAIDAALRGLGNLHAVWYGRVPMLCQQPWLGPVLRARDMVDLLPLWERLASHAAPAFREWAGPEVPQLQQELIGEIDRWWPEVERLPATLIHNDFNPRNVALRSDPEGLRLCAYDWELATLGPPQRDLAEFLCFVLPPDIPRYAVAHHVEVHRRALEAAANCSIPAGPWNVGVRLALRDLLVNRFAFYALIHRFRPQAFLPRVVRTWLALYRQGGDA